MTDEEIAKARALCIDPPEWDRSEQPTCPRCYQEYTIDGPYKEIADHQMCDGCASSALDEIRTLLPAALDALAIARDDAAIARRDADNARKDLLDLRNHLHRSGIYCDDPDCGDRNCPDALQEAVNVRAIETESDLAATKAALAEAIELLNAVHPSYEEWYRHDERLAELKAKVQP